MLFRRMLRASAAVLLGTTLLACGAEYDPGDTDTAESEATTASELAAGGGIGGSLDYTCTFLPGSTSCTCSGAWDCQALHDSGLCRDANGDSHMRCAGPGISNCCCRNDGLTCEPSKTSAPRGGREPAPGQVLAP